MRYHWRMKYLESTKAQLAGSGLHQQFWTEAKELHERLLARLDHYAKRPTEELFVNDAETWAPERLGPR